MAILLFNVRIPANRSTSNSIPHYEFALTYGHYACDSHNFNGQWRMLENIPTEGISRNHASVKCLKDLMENEGSHYSFNPYSATKERSKSCLKWVHLL